MTSYEAAFTAGQEALAADDYLTAAEAFSAALIERPTSEGHFLRANCLMQLERYDDALADCEESIRLLEDVNKDDVYLIKAQALERLGRLDECDQLLKLSSESTRQKLQAFLQSCKPQELTEFEAICAEVHEEGWVWHVLSKKWLTLWKDFLGKRSSPPGPLSNNDIINTLDSNEFWLDPREKKAYSNVALRPGALEGRDYELVPLQAFLYLKDKYGSDKTEIKRWSVSLNDEGSIIQVEVSLKRVTVLVNPGPSGEMLPPRVLQCSRREYVSSLKEKIAYCCSFEPELKCRAWKLEATTDLEAVLRLKRNSMLPNSTLLKDKDELDESELAEDDLVLLEYTQRDGSWTWLSESLETCVYCRKANKLMVCSGCKTVKYCSRDCQSAHFQQHKDLCKKLSRVKNKTHGLTGLHNLGNTCFMNSALQCLSHTVPLTNYFLEDKFTSEVNTRNPIGTGGALAYAYAELVGDLWLSNKDSVSPWKFKKTIGKFAPQFTGFMQHDSHELLSYVLDGLHEDLNRVKTKPYTPSSEVDLNKSDAELSAESWDRHLSRNRSVIVDLMHGQCKSKLVCPICERVSVTFDPFLSYSLQIPNKESCRVAIYFVSRDLSRFPLKVSAELLMSSRLSELRELLVPVVGSRFIWVSMYKNKIKQFPSESTEAADLRFYNLFAFETPPDMANVVTVPLIVTRKGEKGLLYTANKTEAAFTQLLFLKPDTTFKQIHIEVIRLFQTSADFLESAYVSIELVERLLTEQVYTLKIVNSAGYKSELYSYTKQPCDFCGDAKCANCPLPATNNTLEELLSRVKTSRDRLTFELEWAPHVKDLKRFIFVDEYDTVLKAPAVTKAGTLNIRDCFELSSKPEKLDRENAWHCVNCNQQVEAEKTYRLYRLPEILVLHLKRFRSRGVWNEKITSLVEFPVKGLNLSEFVLGDEGAVYDLYAVSNHFGGLGGGHYTACVLGNDGHWYEMDDSTVTRTERVVTAAAYVLFYRRTRFS